jgi:hypothetical protein
MSQTAPHWLSLLLTIEKRAVRIIQPMKILTLLHVTLAQAFYKWAMREIDPTHPDVPRIMLRQKELSDKQRQLFA